MNKTAARIISDSISPNEIRLTTMFVTFPRFLLPEFNTHRVFSRNFRSSRAVPVTKLIEEVRHSPYEPQVWLKNKPGMQATEPMGVDEAVAAQKEWRIGAALAADTADNLLKLGAHKQWANRVLEPYLYVHGVVTSTEWDNFFELRDHKDAQPEIQILAKAIKGAFEGSVPDLLQPGEWHLPFITANDRVGYEPLPYEARHQAVYGSPYVGMVQTVRPLDQLIKISVARCARTSYLTHDGKVPDIASDLRLYNDLVGGRPLHASPAEHQATPDVRVPGQEGPYGEWRVEHWQSPHMHGNLRGWNQNRKFIERDMLSVAA